MSGSSAAGDTVKHLQHATEPPPDTPPDCTADEITFGSGRRRGTGYLARSIRSGPGVLVLHDWFGLRSAPRAFCDALCREGFTALAPDLYQGRTASTVEDARALMDARDQDLIRRQVEAAADHLRDNWHPRLGIVGFSLGASVALDVAPGLAEAVVLYYGTGDPDLGSWKIPVLGHFAEIDDFEPLEDVRTLFASLEAGSAEVELIVYPGTGHWFASEDVPDAFDVNAATAAWETTVDFLQGHLA